MTSQGEYNRTNMLKAIREHANGHIAKHAMNVEIYLNSTGNLLATCEKSIRILLGTY